MIEHFALAIAVGYAVFYWWRWSTYVQRYNELKAATDELFALDGDEP